MTPSVKSPQSSVSDAVILATCRAPRFALSVSQTASEYLEPGADFTITSEDVEGTGRNSGTTYKGLPGDAKLGDSSARRR